MWFSSWSKIGQMLLVGLIFYVALVFLLRISGKRSLAKMNMFDFVVTVALGSMLANVALAGTPLIDALFAISMLLGLQYLISWLSVHYDKFDEFIKPPPTLVMYDGEYIERALTKARVSPRELDENIRQNGFTSKDDVFAVILETTGELSVIGRTDTENNDFSALEMVDCGQTTTVFSEDSADEES